jgi:hypothetical protein
MFDYSGYEQYGYQYNYPYNYFQPSYWKDEKLFSFYSMTEAEKENLSFDHALVYYLGEVSKKVNPAFYKQIIKFAINSFCAGAANKPTY